MAGSYSCDDQTRIHESKEGIPFIALRITLSFLHWIRKSYERLFKTCAHHLRKKNAYISNHHTHWKHSKNLKEISRLRPKRGIWLERVVIVGQKFQNVENDEKMKWHFWEVFYTFTTYIYSLVWEFNKSLAIYYRIFCCSAIWKQQLLKVQNLTKT